MVARAEQFLDYFYKTEQIHSTGCSHFRDISILLLSRHVSAVCLRLILNLFPRIFIEFEAVLNSSNSQLFT